MDERRNMVKARLAEALVEEMFLHLGFEVYRFGVENTVPGLKGRVSDADGPVGNLVRRMPDFLVRSPGGVLTLVEVKFRADGRLDAERARVVEGHPYSDALYVLVHPRGMKAIRGMELLAGRAIVPGDKRLLGFEPGFASYAREIIAFCDLAKFFFAAVA